MLNSTKPANKGRLVFKSKTPRKTLNIVLYVIIDMVLIYFFSDSLYLLFTLVNLNPSEYLTVIVLSLLPMIICSSLSFILTYAIIRKFLVYLFIFERGIEIREVSLIPLSFKKEYLPYVTITNVEIRRVQPSNQEFFVHRIKGKSTVLNEHVISINLEEVKNIILKNMEEVCFST